MTSTGAATRTEEPSNCKPSSMFTRSFPQFSDEPLVSGHGMCAAAIAAACCFRTTKRLALRRGTGGVRALGHRSGRPRETKKARMGSARPALSQLFPRCDAPHRAPSRCSTRSVVLFSLPNQVSPAAMSRSSRSWLHPCGVLALCLLALALASLCCAPASAFVRPPQGIQNKVYLRLQMLSLSRIDGKDKHAQVRARAHTGGTGLAPSHAHLSARVCSAVCVCAVRVCVRVVVALLFVCASGVNQVFSADFFMLMLHAAPNPPSTGLVCNVTQCDVLSAAIYADVFWDPRLEFINSQGTILALQGEPYSMTLVPPFLNTDPLPDGWVWIQTDQRFQGSFSTELNMNAFPFDIQHVQMEAQLTWPNDTAAIIYPEATPDKIGRITKGMADNLGWDFLHSDLITGTQGYDYNQQVYSRLIYTSTWKRQPQYYLAKIVAGTMLLVWMCIWNFSLQIDVSDRMMGTLQVFTGLISFLFVAGGDTPKLPYQTRLDVFMLFSFCIVGFIMFIHGVLYYFREQGFEGAAAEKLQAIEKRKRKALLQKLRKNQQRKGGGGGDGGGGAGSMQINPLAAGGSSIGSAYLANSPSIPEGGQEVELGEFGGAAAPPRAGAGPVDGAPPLAPYPVAGLALAIPSPVAGSPPGVLPSPSAATAPSGSPRLAGSPRLSIDANGSKDSARGGAGTARGAGVANNDSATERKEINSDVEIRVLPGGPSQSGAAPNLLTSRLTAREAHARGVTVSNFVNDSPSAQGQGQGKAHDQAASDADDDEHAGWEIRLSEWKSFSFTEWFAALACTRKWDAILVPLLFLFYTIGCAAILGRPASDGRRQ